MPNRLANESSPYLLQHRDNPVDWYPWGDEALERARREEKPIFLSIGYSACHWCHVMEHESFENESIARVLNENFIAIKVDREERPDLDQIYMNAVQMLTGHGGWPMSVFLTTDLKPFYGGTYWPPHGSGGMPGFDQILAAVIDAWKNRRQQALDAAEQLTTELQKVSVAGNGHHANGLTLDLIDSAVAQLRRTFDNTYGGFGQAPKFPHPMDLQLLVRTSHRTRQQGPLDMVRLTLDRMAAGGIYDHLGGGFARYSVDARWLVPHFEKMLYDNALLSNAYLDAYLVTGDANYARVLRETLNYVIRDMTNPAGGFYSTEDADSEGHEGRFYTWTPAAIHDVLGADRAATFCRVYDVSDIGNFEGRNILHLPKTLEQCAAILHRDSHGLAAELTESREKLFAAREKRIRPNRDDKVIVAWNGLMIDAMARIGAGLNEPEYVIVADDVASFILSRMRREDGRLLHSWRNGHAKLDAYLDDYTALANGLVSLYEATFKERCIDAAVQLIDIVLDKFADPTGAGFFYTASDHEQLITRTKELTDSSTPSGNALAASVLLRLGRLLGRSDYLNAAQRTMAVAAPIMQRAPMAAGQMLLALDCYIGPANELVLVGDMTRDDTKQAIAAIHRRYLPRTVFAARDTSSSDPTGAQSQQLNDIFVGKDSPDGRPVLYVCENFACKAPAVGLAAIESAVDRLAPHTTP
ncbi:MAG TPA: thioredoxin domain-containing protein [Lacipirellulaceae bacterium]|nr:thioredoxin domain-containing protein [Lacipirellulaceae bacterium]